MVCFGGRRHTQMGGTSFLRLSHNREYSWLKAATDSHINHKVFLGQTQLLLTSSLSVTWRVSEIQFLPSWNEAFMTILCRRWKYTQSKMWVINSTIDKQSEWGRAGEVPQAVECLPSKQEAMSSSPSTAKVNGAAKHYGSLGCPDLCSSLAMWPGTRCCITWSSYFLTYNGNHIPWRDLWGMNRMRANLWSLLTQKEQGLHKR
jgi:hypothetical protein